MAWAPDPRACTPLPYAHYCRDGEPVHAMRYHWPCVRELGWTVRDHWHAVLVESGVALFQAAGGEVERLEAGRLRIVPAGTPHQVRAGADDGVLESYLVVLPAVVERLATALGGDRPAGFPWRTGAPAVTAALDAEAVAEWTRLIDGLIMRPPTMADAVICLGQVVRLHGQAADVPYADLPAWLRQAVIRLRSPDHLQEGLPALVRLAGRSADHINRTVRRCRGITASDLVNGLRMEMAGARARLTGERVVDIAATVGIVNLGHFYRLFKAAYGCTPKAWRDRHR